eukprot:5454888-Amphidinium_carterae.1
MQQTSQTCWLQWTRKRNGTGTMKIKGAMRNRLRLGTLVSSPQDSWDVNIVQQEPDGYSVTVISDTACQRSVDVAIPFLLSRGALESLGAEISLASSTLTMTKLPAQPVLPSDVIVLTHSDFLEDENGDAFASTGLLEEDENRDVFASTNVLEAGEKRDVLAPAVFLAEENNDVYLHDSCVAVRLQNLPMMRPALRC